MATPKRLSPGVYEIDGKTYRGKTSAEAMAAYNAAQKKTTTSKTGGGTKKTLPNTTVSNTAGKVNFSDPNSVASSDIKIKQEIANQDTIRANPNEISDFGEKTVTYDPVTGQPTITSRLTGTNKELVEGQQRSGSLGAQVAGNLIGNVGSYDPNSLNEKYGIPQVNDQYMQRYQDAAYNQLTRRLEQSYAKDKEAKAQELVNRGIPQGSQQFQDEMNRDVENRYADERSAAANQAYSAGLGAGKSYFDMGLSANQQANQNYNEGFGNRVLWGGQLNKMAEGQNAPGQEFQSAQTGQTDLGGIYGTRTAEQVAREQARRRAAGGGGAQPSNQPAVDL
jgi:hypothetical protein